MAAARVKFIRYCVVGYPVAHSRSPQLHNKYFIAKKIAARYVREEVKPENLGEFMVDFRRKYAGANVTIPHKEAVIQYLDKLSAEAQKIGAVNTIVNNKGQLIGYNTDVYGALEALKKGGVGRLKNSLIGILGAGGAARAIVYGLCKNGAKVTIFNRTMERAQKLAEEFGAQARSIGELTTCSFDVFINATPIGMKNKNDDIRGKKQVLLPHAKFVFDIVYTPKFTPLLRAALKAGSRVITGNLMFEKQAECSRKLWFNRLYA